MMLYKLISRMDRRLLEPKVISLMDIGQIGQKIQTLAVPVLQLGMRRGVANPLHLLRLVRWLQKNPPDIIQTWMYHADIIGGLAAKLIGNIPVVWNIRHTNLEPQVNKRSTIWTAKTCASLSSWLPVRIVCCAETARWIHEELGYAANKMVVIPNGFDMETFKPDPSARLAVRSELGIPKNAPLIGLIARFDPQKDHHNAIQGAALLHGRMPDVHFLFCGNGVTMENQELATWIKDAGIGDVCHLLGRREDIQRINAALDIASSSSCGEGFPNAIGEAMACEVPCVVTDVGDSAYLVGNTGSVVPPKSPKSLSEAWTKLLTLSLEERRKLGQQARKRVAENFSLAYVVEQYQNLWLMLIQMKRER